LDVYDKHLRLYQTTEGKIPFRDWFNGIQDRFTREIVATRLQRVKKGLLGDSKSVGFGVCELKVDYGPGHRVYFGQDGNKIIILLCGGDKSSQSRDILKAIEYWMDYRGNKKWQEL
jgi:putative addiction module killer protein